MSSVRFTSTEMAWIAYYGSQELGLAKCAENANLDKLTTARCAAARVKQNEIERKTAARHAWILQHPLHDGTPTPSLSAF